MQAQAKAKAKEEEAKRHDADNENYRLKEKVEKLERDLSVAKTALNTSGKVSHMSDASKLAFCACVAHARPLACKCSGR